MDFLSEIIECKRARVDEARRLRSLEEVQREALEVRRSSAAHELRTRLKDRSRVNVIAEVKRASPSKGTIRADVNPARLALSYQSGGACAISVLTEEDRFRGSLEDLRAVREAVELPLLRKDFIFDEYQLYEAAAAGASALLLIVAALDDETLKRLMWITEGELGMDALVEVHTAREFERAALCGATLVGVNNRNLHTFEVSIDTSIELARLAPENFVMISESGLSTAQDLRLLRAAGYRGFLIGETLMRAQEPEEALRALLAEAQED